jgi:hypothetical protein
VSQTYDNDNNRNCDRVGGGGGVLEVIHAISAIVVGQLGEELGVGGFSRADLFQTDLSVLVVDLVDEEAASVLRAIRSER